MNLAVSILRIFLVIGAVCSILYYILCLIAAHRFFEQREAPGSSEDHPCTILIPLSGAEFEARENYMSFCRQNFSAKFQIVFGVLDPQDSAIPVVRKLMTDFPDSDIELVVGSRIIGENRKVSNLQNMIAHAKHDWLLIVDSDIRVGPDYLRQVTLPLADQQIGLVTCLYHAANAPDFGSLLEVMGISSEFAPGVLVARMLEGLKFALGSTMALRKETLESIGGFASVATYLADDYMLGNKIAAAGKQVLLSHSVVETVMKPASLRSAFKHQMRWGRSTRISRPLGYLGLILTYGLPLATFNLILSHASSFSLILFAVTLFARYAVAWRIGVHYLRDPILKKNLWLVPVRDFFSFLIWLVSWMGRTVEWRGTLFRVYRDGSFRRLT